MYYQITKNGRRLEDTLTKEQALEKLMLCVDEYSHGYHYCPDKKIIYNEVDNIYAVGKMGDEWIQAGDDRFKIKLDFYFNIFVI